MQESPPPPAFRLISKLALYFAETQIGLGVRYSLTRQLCQHKCAEADGRLAARENLVIALTLGYPPGTGTE